MAPLLRRCAAMTVAGRSPSLQGAPRQRARRFALTPAQWTSLVFVQAWLFLLLRGWTLLLDPGTFWHVVTGERVLRAGLPRADWLSFTAAGRPWIAHQWLAEVAMALLHAIGGLDAIVVVVAGAIAALLAWLCHRLLAAGIGAGAAVTVTVLAAAACQHQFHARPLVVSMLLFAWTYARLVDVETGAVSIPRLALALPVFAVWANAHGGALGGVATVAIAGGGWIARWVWRQPSPVRTWRDAGWVVGISLGSTLATLANPYGLELWRTWRMIMGSAALARNMQEHQPFWLFPVWLSLGFILVFVVVAALASPRWRSLRVTSLASIVWLALALDRTRHLPLFAIAATLALPDLLAACRWNLLRWRPREASGEGPRGHRIASTCALCMAGAIAITCAVHRVLPGRDRLVALSPARWPVDVLDQITAEQRAAPDGAPILNDMLYGGYLAYFAPRLRLFIDDRWELYGDDFVVSYCEGRPEWFSRWVAAYAPVLALAHPGSALDRFLSGDRSWAIVATSSAAVLYRRTPEPISVARARTE